MYSGKCWCKEQPLKINDNGELIPTQEGLQIRWVIILCVILTQDLRLHLVLCFNLTQLR